MDRGTSSFSFEVETVYISFIHSFAKKLWFSKGKYYSRLFNITLFLHVDILIEHMYVGKQVFIKSRNLIDHYI
jgi:hypothetical protein